MAEQNAEATEQTTLADIANTVQIPEGDKVTTVEGNKPVVDNVEDFKQFAAKFDALDAEVKANSQKTADFVDSQNRETVNKEILSAAERINENTGGDIELAKLFLEQQYNNDPNVKKIWDNRGIDPEAQKKAEGILNKEWAAMNVNQIDPVVAANQRALQESQKPGSAVQTPSIDDDLNKLEDGDLLRTLKKLSLRG
jgi:hypothetical protein